MTDTHVTTFEVEATAVEDFDVFKRRMTALEQQGPWDDLDNDQRRALVLLMRPALLRLAEDPASWLPDSLVPHRDGHVAALIVFEWDEVDATVTASCAAAEAQLASCRNELLTTHRELQDGR